MAEVRIENGTAEVRQALMAARERALCAVGSAWAGHARAAATEDAVQESLRWEVRDGMVAVGSELDEAAYAELGTRRYYSPPEWMENRVQRGTKAPPGAEEWVYFDPADGQFKIGGPRPAAPFLRPALEAHVPEYQRMVEAALRGEG